MQPKYTKMNKQEFPSVGRNELDFFCASLYTKFLSDLHEKFQVASTYVINIKYQIWCSCCNFPMSHVDKKHWYRHRLIAKNVIFGFS